MNEQLLIIDPQYDFCNPNGALYVQGADQDMSRLANFIRNYGDKLSDIHVTLDTHHYFDVAHPVFWKDSKGNHPNPFTIITANDVENGVWTPSVVSLTRRMTDYVKALESQGKYPLCIWPPHCLIGSNGHQVVDELFQELVNWERNLGFVNYVTKGTNPYTEHYSAVKAEVVDPSDPTTQINPKLLEIDQTADIIYVAGEAGSHCLAYTLRDLVDSIGSQEFVNKIHLLLDCTSPVVGAIDFTPEQDKFVKEMKAKGMKVTTTDAVLSVSV